MYTGTLCPVLLIQDNIEFAGKGNSWRSTILLDKQRTALGAVERSRAVATYDTRVLHNRTVLKVVFDCVVTHPTLLHYQLVVSSML